MQSPCGNTCRDVSLHRFAHAQSFVICGTLVCVDFVGERNSQSKRQHDTYPMPWQREQLVTISRQQTRHPSVLFRIHSFLVVCYCCFLMKPAWKEATLAPWQKYYAGPQERATSPARSSRAATKRTDPFQVSWTGRFEKDASATGRADVPDVRATKRGSSKKLQDIIRCPNKVRHAAQRFQHYKFAKTTVKPKESRKRTFDCIAGKISGSVALPLTPGILDAVGGAMKEAGYRTTSKYLNEAKLSHIEAGHVWSEQLARALKLSKMAADRGIGPPRKAGEIRLALSLSMSRGERPLVRGGPCFPRRAWVISAFWLLREIEAAGVKVDEGHIKFDAANAVLQLPASKTDTGGLGCRRVLHCTCSIRCMKDGSVRGSDVCPVCCMRSQVEYVRGRFGPNAPLFANEKGEVPSKNAMVRTWRSLYCEATGCDASERVALSISGHSARRSGAKMLARCGWSLWQIQHHGRWGSDVIKMYIEETFSEIAETWRFDEAAAEDV